MNPPEKIGVPCEDCPCHTPTNEEKCGCGILRSKHGRGANGYCTPKVNLWGSPGSSNKASGARFTRNEEKECACENCNKPFPELGGKTLNEYNANYDKVMTTYNPHAANEIGECERDKIWMGTYTEVDGVAVNISRKNDDWKLEDKTIT